jgi:hypothetical protein
MNVKERISAYDATEIAARFCGLKGDDYDDAEVENALAEKHDISLETFTEIVQWCYDRIGVDVSPLSKTTYAGFADGLVWLVKKDVSGPIINFIINWILDGTEYNLDGKGHEKTITKAGKPEFKIVITRAANKVTVRKPNDKANPDADKRFLLFGFPQYYPGGGMSDMVDSYDTLEEGMEALKKDDSENKYLYDRIEGVTIDID